MTSKQVVALDMMGGDHGLSVTVDGACMALGRCPELAVIMVGDKPAICTALAEAQSGDLRPRITVHHASEQVHMHDSLTHALRRKRDSSMRVALDLVKSGQAFACVSAGNTGALMAMARLVLRTLPGIDRPAIVATFPTRVSGKLTYVLDLGANVDCSPTHLCQFALMGAILAQEMVGGEHAAAVKVGLLNVGTEDIKGSPTVKETHQQLMRNPYIDYVGYVEGGDVFSGVVDVIVCDGFVGNVLLKTCEGEARLIYQYLRQAFSQSWCARAVALLAQPILKGLRGRLDPGKRNGATLLGLKGIVIKSHGNADAVAFSYAIEEAVRELDGCILQKIAKAISRTQTMDPEKNKEETHAV